MKKLLTATALTMALASPALAECDSPFPLSLFDEKADGTNCEPTKAEKVAGDLIVLTLISAAMIDASGAAEIFPLNSSGGAVSAILPK